MCNFKEELYMSEMIDISNLKTWDKPHKVYIPSKYGVFVKKEDLEKLLEIANNNYYTKCHECGSTELLPAYICKKC